MDKLMAELYKQAAKEARGKKDDKTLAKIMILLRACATTPTTPRREM